MLFIPYRFDAEFFRFPAITIVICIVCIAIYGQQVANEREYITKTEHFCESVDTNIERMMLDKVMGDSTPAGCRELVVKLTVAEDQKATIDDMVINSEPFAAYSKADSQEYMRMLIERVYGRFRQAVPPLETRELWYHPHSWDPWAMVTASFAHGSWDHLIGNLFFFFAFAAAVEIMVGPLIYAGIILAMAFGTGVSYSLAMANVAEALPTVGLSGIVMGMMALFTYFLPTGKIKCFYWFLIKVGTLSIPAWILTAWFVGFDAYQLFTQEEQGGVNLVYHVSGAVIGVLIGLVFLRGRRRELHESLG